MPTQHDTMPFSFLLRCKWHSFMKWFFNVLLLSMLWIVSWSAISDIKVINLFNIESENLNGKVYFLEDKQGTLSIDQVSALPDEAFQQARSKAPLNFGYSHATYWIKIPLQHWGPSGKKTYILEIDVPLMDSVIFYQTGELKPVEPKSTSYNTPLNHRYINYAGHLFPFTLDDHAPATLYLQIQSDYSLHIPLTIYSEQALVKAISIKELLHSSFFGGMIVIILYHLLVFISTKEKGYLNYIFYISAYLLFMLTERVHGLQIFEKVPYLFNREFLPSYIWLSWLLAFQMTREILKSKSTMPSYDFVIRLIIHASALSAVISLFTEPATAIRWAVTGTIICAFGLAIFGYKATKRKLPGATLYFWAWAVNFTAVAVYALSVTGLLPYNLLTSSAPQLGLVCHIILISLALGNKISSAQNLAVEANEIAITNGRRYENLFNNASDGCFIAKSDGTITTLNPSCLKILGYDQVNGLISDSDNIFSILFPNDESRQTALRHLRLHSHFSTEIPYTNTNTNNTRWLKVSFSKASTDGLGTEVLEGTLVDISDKRERANIEKERQKDVMLKEAAEATALSKTRFLANMSHELRTPLTAIIGYSESLKEDSLSSLEREVAISTIVRSGNHLLNLVNDMLDHANISGDSLEIQIQPVNLLQLVQDVASYFKPHAAKKSISLSIDYQFPMPKIIQTDPTRLRQILINLTGNAIKFTEQGEITLKASFQPENKIVSMSVKDTGIGLRPEQITKIFDPFSQASASTARMYGGTGLGLSISKKLAEKLGGGMSISSEYGKGSEFTFTLQGDEHCSQSLLHELPEMYEQSQRIPLPAPPALTGRVLYAADCDLTRKLLSIMTRKTGLDMSIVNSGQEALRQTDLQSYDLIIVDINYSDSGGWKTVQAVRASGYKRPIIALTADVMEASLKKYLNAGCNECLHKPINQESFYSSLTYYLANNVSESICDN